MLRVGIAVLAAAALLGVAALAFGQDIVPIKVAAVVKVTPNKAGTPAHPQGVKVEVLGTVDIPHDYDPPLVEYVDIWIPKGALYNGAKFPTCSFAAMERTGLKTCPARSIMGHGTVTADADGVTSVARFTAVNGGATKIYSYVRLSTPARVRQTVVTTITKLNSPRWGYKLHLAVPRNLQIVAGIPLRVERFHGFFGREDWLASTYCPPDHKWRWHAEGHYASGQVVGVSGSVACRS
ncbi:hypothetical protein [Baekduia sp.]|jgi:hypothetical protein|uniref:hypothetical protein n=1 Tax=Baekduia sp. TaxID=2600305 RepID=UPI002E0024E6|nr:hypothetical protein [Baekduia sp.]